MFRSCGNDPESRAAVAFNLTTLLQINGVFCVYGATLSTSRLGAKHALVERVGILAAPRVKLAPPYGSYEVRLNV